MTKVSSYDEFTDLETVILGTFSKDGIPLEIQKPNADISKALELIDWVNDEPKQANTSNTAKAMHDFAKNPFGNTDTDFISDNKGLSNDLPF